MPVLANPEYAARVNAAIDYVTQNLAGPLALEDVARAAAFSPFHFHRIFRAATGETLAAFVRRTRLERSLYLLSHHRRATLTEIALACGFSSSSDYSRAFRAHYGAPPRRFDLSSHRRAGEDAMRSTLSAADQPHRLDPAAPPPDTQDADSERAYDVTLRRLAARHVAYIRVQRPYEGDGVQRATARLVAWAEARSLADGQWLGYQWDDPEIVPLDKCRYDVGLEVPETTRPEGEVGLTSFDACTVAEIEIKGTVELELRALHWLFRTWLPGSGFAPAHQPMFEAWNGRPFAHGAEHFEIRIQLPVVDARSPL